MRMIEPAAIMKSRPTPGITGNPIPAAVGINPISIVTIRLPAVAINDDRRPPAPTVAIQVHPAAIRRQGVVKIVHRYFGWRGRLRFRGGGWWCFRTIWCRAGLLQLLVVLHHRIGNFRRRSQIIQINDFFRIEVEQVGGVADVSQNDALLDAGLHQPDDLGERAVGIDVRWQRTGGRCIIRGCRTQIGV